MRVDLLTFAALILNTQWVAGNPQVVNPKYLDPTDATTTVYAESSGQYGNVGGSDIRYASASPYMSIEGDPTMSASFGTVTVYPTGMANKETSSPGVLFDQSDSTDDTDELGNVDDDHTETVYITIGNGDEDGSESPSQDGPVTVTVGGSGDGPVTVTVGASNDGPETVTVDGSKDGPETVTVGASGDDKPEVVTPVIQVNMQVVNGQTVPVTNTISPNNPSPTSGNEPQIITVTANPTDKDVEAAGPATVTVYGPSPTNPSQIIVQNDGAKTVTVTQTNMHTDYVTVTDGVNGNSQGNGGTNIVVVGGQNGGGVVNGANGLVSMAPNSLPPTPNKTTYLKTIMTASMDIVRVIGPTYTRTIAINGNNVGNQPTQAPQMPNPYVQNFPSGVPPPNNMYFGQNGGGANYQYYGQNTPSGGPPNNAFFGQNSGSGSYQYYGQNNGGSFPGQNNNMNIPGPQNTPYQSGSSSGVVNNVPIIQ